MTVAIQISKFPTLPFEPPTVEKETTHHHSHRHESNPKLAQTTTSTRRRIHSQKNPYAEEPQTVTAEKHDSMRTALIVSSPIPRDRSPCDTAYFPECRKDTNCHCEMCIASINATLDLVSSRTVQAPSTPPPTPELRSTAKSRVRGRLDEEEGKRGCGYGILRWVAVILAIAAVDYAIPVIARAVWGGARLEGEEVRRAAEGAAVAGGDLKGMLGALEGLLVGIEMGNRSSDGTNWVLHKEGHLLHMKCVIYRSLAEELSIWGFPLKTSGLIVTGLSSRSFTLLSGQIHEWHEEKLDFNTRRPGSSWASKRWSMTAMHLGANSWILEYRRSALFQEWRVFPVMKELLRSRFLEVKEELTQRSWLLPIVPERLHFAHRSVEHDVPPT